MGKGIERGEQGFDRIAKYYLGKVLIIASDEKVFLGREYSREFRKREGKVDVLT